MLLFLPQDNLSFRLRLAFAVSHISIFLISIYFYWRHNAYCEPYGILNITYNYRRSD